MLKEEIKEVDVLQFQKTLDASQWAKSSQYVSSEEAAAILQKDLGEDFISFLELQSTNSFHRYSPTCRPHITRENECTGE